MAACHSPTSANTVASPMPTAASARGTKSGKSARATVASSAANGSVKKASRLVPASTSSAHSSDRNANAKKAAAGYAMTVGSARTWLAAQRPPAERERGGEQHEVERQQPAEPAVVGDRDEEPARGVELDRRPEGRRQQHRDRHERRPPGQQRGGAAQDDQAEHPRRRPARAREPVERTGAERQRQPGLGGGQQHEPGEQREAPAREQHEHGCERAADRGQLGGVSVLHRGAD